MYNYKLATLSVSKFIWKIPFFVTIFFTMIHCMDPKVATQKEPDYIPDYIFLATGKQDEKTLEAWLASGGNVDAVEGEYHHTLLSSSILLNYRMPKMAQFFIRKGANVNCTTKQGVSPLHNCCVRRKVNSLQENNEKLVIATLLIDKKADVNAQTAYGATPLRLACETHNAPMVDLLCSRGATVNTKIRDCDEGTDANFEYSNVLYFYLDLPKNNFSESSNPIIVQKLIQYGCDFDAKDACNIAIRNGKDSSNTRLLEFLGYQVDLQRKISQCFPEGIDAIVASYAYGDIDPLQSANVIVRTYRKIKLKFKNSDDDEQVVYPNRYLPNKVRLAAIKGDKKAIEHYLQKGGNINALSESQNTLLSLALHNKNNDLALFLLNKKANPNCAGIYGILPLVRAISNNDKDMAAVLIKSGALIDNSSDGTLPLLYTIDIGNHVMFEWLLQNGAILHNNEVVTRTGKHIQRTFKNILFHVIPLSNCELSIVQRLINRGINFDPDMLLKSTFVIKAEIVNYLKSQSEMRKKIHEACDNYKLEFDDNVKKAIVDYSYGTYETKDLSSQNQAVKEGKEKCVVM